MLAKLMLVASLFTQTAATRNDDPQQLPQQMSLGQKLEAVRPFIDGTTACVIGWVNIDPHRRIPGSNPGDVIVFALTVPCLKSARKMSDAFDENFGTDAGETFLMGIYLNKVLPRAIKAAHDNSTGPPS
jgi:hypothetical protein